MAPGDTTVGSTPSWQIAFGPYVADYSRYLPRAIRAGRVFAAVGLGSILGAQIAMTFGVLAAALAGAEFEHHEVVYIVRLGSTGAVAALLFFCIAFGKIMVTSLNSYGSLCSRAPLGPPDSRTGDPAEGRITVRVTALIAARHCGRRPLKAAPIDQPCAWAKSAMPC